jgi:hypothetical protein
MGGTSGCAITMPNVPLYDEENRPNQAAELTMGIAELINAAQLEILKGRVSRMRNTPCSLRCSVEHLNATPP